MDILTGHLYHIHDSFYDRFPNCNLLYNKGDSFSRPVCVAIQDKTNTDLFWAVPLSSKIKKYKAIYEKSMDRYGGVCDTLSIAKYAGIESVFLIQNMFPVTKKYISHLHTIGDSSIPLIKTVSDEISKKANKLLVLHKAGKTVVFTDIDYILNDLLSQN